MGEGASERSSLQQVSAPSRASHLLYYSECLSEPLTFYSSSPTWPPISDLPSHPFLMSSAHFQDLDIQRKVSNSGDGPWKSFRFHKPGLWVTPWKFPERRVLEHSWRVLNLKVFGIFFGKTSREVPECSWKILGGL